MNETPHSNDEVDLLDFLVLLTENIKLLLLAPILVGVSTFFFTPPPSAKTYEATAIIDPNLSLTGSFIEKINQIKATNPAKLAGLATSAPVLNSVREKLNLFPEKTQNEAYISLRNAVKSTVNTSNGFVTISVSGENPELTQKITDVLLTSLFNQVNPKDRAFQQISSRLEQETRLYNKNLQLQEKLATEIANGNDSDRISNSYAILTDSNTKLSESIRNLEIQAHRIDRENLIQSTIVNELPATSNPLKRPLVSITAAGAAFISALLFLIIRKTWKNICENPLSAPKIARLRQSFNKNPGV